MQDWKDVEKNARKWVREAGGLIVASLQETLVIETKTNASDLVTNMDRQIEQYFIERIQSTYPGHRVLGEEGYGDDVVSAEGTIWMIDPIDGTMNFIHQKRNFAVSVAVYHEGEGMIGLIYDPVHKEMYHATRGEGAYCNGERIPKLQPGTVSEGVIAVNAMWLTENPKLNSEKMASLVRDARGTRSYGCAALEIVYVATGRLDGYITPRLSPWDFAAGAVIVQEVGGIITSFDGKALNPVQKGSVLVARPAVHTELLQYVQ